MWSRQARLPRYDEGVYSLETVYRYRFRPINRMRISIKGKRYLPYHNKAFRMRLRDTFSDVLEAIDEMLLRTSYEEIDDACDDS